MKFDSLHCALLALVVLLAVYVLRPLRKENLPLFWNCKSKDLTASQRESCIDRDGGGDRATQ